MNNNDKQQQKFACSTCRLWLTSVDEQRAHFRTQLHAFNVRRKVVGMLPVTQEQFNDRIAMSKDDSATDDTPEDTMYGCKVCKKTFKTEETLEQHFKSNKHVKAANGMSNEDARRDLVRKTKQEEESTTSGTTTAEESVIDKKVAKGRRLGFLECSLCGETGFTAAENTAEHMAKAHDFFIPDIEYLVSLEGLLAYLGDKVGVGHCCVFCHQPFDSLSAARQHMVDMSHFKIVWNDDQDEEAGEYDEFYDFAESYKVNLPEIRVSEDGTQLMIGDHKSVGHRDLQVYYKQNVRMDSETKALVVAERREKSIQMLAARYKCIGWSGSKTSLETAAARAERQRHLQTMQKEQLSAGLQKNKSNRLRFRRQDIMW